MDSAKTSSGRTEWQLIEGRLKETGPDTPTFTLTATDTQTLLDLLMQNEKAIRQAVSKEHTLPVTRPTHS